MREPRRRPRARPPIAALAVAVALLCGGGAVGAQAPGTGLAVEAPTPPGPAVAPVPRTPERTAADDPFDGFEQFVRSVMEQWEVPGLAVAAIQDGEVVISRGFGYADVENTRAVTPRTLFAIGSNTKSFTATLLGMLVDEGQLEWDRPVGDYIPDFRMHDPVATRGMTPEDLVTHRSGLPRYDLVWYGSDLSREEMVHRLRYLEPSEPFRSAWQYQNLMFLTAGHLAERVSGKSWETLVDQRILTPLGMDRSNFSTGDLPGTDDFAYPYAMRDSQVVRIPYRNIDAVGPAGSINSSVEEMIRYVQFHLDGGTVDGERLLSEANSEAMQSPQMAMPGDRRDRELGHNSYGLGLVVGSYRGHTLVRHGGGIDGFISSMAWLPDDSIGVVVLTNLGGDNPVPGIVTWNVMDRLLGLEEVDWAGRIEERQEEQESPEGEGDADRVEGTSPTHALEDYVGRYEHPAYGTLEVRTNGSGLAYRYHDFSGPLRHWHYDVFRVEEDETSPLSRMKVMFHYDADGRIDRISAPLEPAVEDLVFERAADESMRDPELLARFTGEYQLGSQTVRVTLRGDRLALTVPGQPTYTLVPDRGTSFDLEDLPGVRVEFQLPASGPATEAIFHRPDGTFTATRKP